MAKRKRILQKLSVSSAVVSLLLALASGVALYFRLQDVGIDDPITASLIASTFFFICIGFVFFIMGTADLPSFKTGSSKKK